MDADDIRTWSDRYDEVYDKDLREIENRIHESLNDQQYLTGDQLQDVVRWKLNGMPGRRGGNVDRVDTAPNEFVQRVTEAALLTDEPTIGSSHRP